MSKCWAWGCRRKWKERVYYHTLKTLTTCQFNKRRFHLNEFFALHLPLSCYHCYPLPSLHKKNPWLSALFFQLPIDRQRHLHRDEKIQLHFTEIATRFFQQFVQPLTSWHRIETFSRQSSNFRKIPLYTRSTTIKQAQYYLASFSVKIDSPQEILLRPRPRPRLLLLRFLLVANNCATSHLRYLQISSALFSNFPEYSPSRSTASPSSLSTGRATKNSKRVTRYFTGPRSGKKWEFLGPTVNCVCKTPGCPIDPMVHW